MIGDSLAAGTPLANAMPNHHVVTRARVGIGATEGIRRLLHPLSGVDVVIVSLGTNDRSPTVVGRAARTARRAVAHRCLLWVQVAGVPRAAAINHSIRAAHVRMIPWRSHTVHPGPRGYRLRARRIARHVRACT